MYTVGPGLWRENGKNVKNETQSLKDLQYGDKTDQQGK